MTEVQQQPKRGCGRPPGTGTGIYKFSRKRSAFVANMADGMELTAAALQAGYRASSARRTALRLMRVAAIRAAIADAGDERVQLLEQLDAAKAMATAAGDASAVVEAIRLRCVLLGLL
jgi:phage terminase small subunit